MSYEVLARKLRPAGFDALVGQDHVVRALTHALDHDRLHHAYLFTGTRGVGKTTIARIVAKSLNCEQGVSSKPCNECSICMEIKQNRFVDLIEVDAASRTGVDDTRDLLENAQYMPARGRYKVYLIDEVHMLSTQSFNALLKTLEEPPAHVKFLLATTDPKKVPVTVLSRCLQFQLKNLSKDSIADYLANVLTDEKVQFESAALAVIARSAAGSMRDALSLTDQAIAFGNGQLKHDDIAAMLGVVGRDEVGALLTAIAAGEASALMQVVTELAEKNIDFDDVLSSLVEAFHAMSVSLALGNNAPNNAPNADSEHLDAELAAQFTAEELQLYYQIGLIGRRDLRHAPDPRVGFEMTVLRMLSFTPERQAGSPGSPATAVPARTGETDKGQVDSQSGSAASPADGPSAVGQIAIGQGAIGEGATGERGDELKQPATAASEATLNPPSEPVSTDQNPPVQSLGMNEFAQAWIDLIDQCEVSGVTRMIAEHSVLKHFELPDIRLLLDEGHDTLLSDAQERNLTRALSDVLGRSINLSIKSGQPDAETPAQTKARKARERQAQAETTIHEDVNVQNLLAEFGGQIEHIRPL